MATGGVDGCAKGREGGLLESVQEVDSMAGTAVQADCDRKIGRRWIAEPVHLVDGDDGGGSRRL